MKQGCNREGVVWGGAKGACACALCGNVVIAIGVTSKQVPKILVRRYCKNPLIKIMSQCTYLYKW